MDLKIENAAGKSGASNVVYLFGSDIMNLNPHIPTKQTEIPDGLAIMRRKALDPKYHIRRGMHHG